MIQWLRHHTSTSGGVGSIPGPTCQAVQLKSKKKEKLKKYIRTRKGQNSRLNWQARFTRHLYSLFFLQDPYEMPRSGATILPLLGAETQALVVQAEA